MRERQPFPEQINTEYGIPKPPKTSENTGGAVSGALVEKRGRLESVPLDEDQNIMVAGETEEGREKELSSAPIQLSKERIGQLNDKDLLGLKQEMIMISRQLKPLKNEQVEFEATIRSYERGAQRKPDETGRQERLANLKKAEKEWLQSNLPELRALETEREMIKDLIAAKEKIENAA
jgi:hypothetical protein